MAGRKALCVRINVYKNLPNAILQGCVDDKADEGSAKASWASPLRTLCWRYGGVSWNACARSIRQRIPRR